VPEESKNRDMKRHKFLQFSCGREKFAIPLMKVREVIGVPKTTPAPFSPDYYMGIMNLRGKILSVIDLCRKIEVETFGIKEENAVIIVDIEGIIVGLKVDSVDKVVFPEEGSFVSADQLKTGRKNAFINGVFRMSEELVIIFDLNKILSGEELRFLSEEAS